MANGAILGQTPPIDKYLPLSGGTMTGNLILNKSPTQNMQAATKKYVDESISKFDDGWINITNDWEAINVSGSFYREYSISSNIAYSTTKLFKIEYAGSSMNGQTVYFQPETSVNHTTTLKFLDNSWFQAGTEFMDITMDSNWNRMYVQNHYGFSWNGYIYYKISCRIDFN